MYISTSSEPIFIAFDMTEKCFSTEEALNLLLETTDHDDSSDAGSSESDVNVVSVDPPGPKAMVSIRTALTQISSSYRM